MSDITLPYHTPDSRWNYQGATTYESYLQKFVFKSKFHSKVPEDIIKDYETAEQLMAHAWYHYPMYDEGFKKLLGMVEMAVKKRCEQLNIDLSKKDKKGNDRRKTLNQLMIDLHKADPHKNLNFDLQKARKVRNFYAHPENHTFVGAIAQLSLIQIINLINFIFLEQEPFIQQNKYAKEMEAALEPFEKGCFKLEINNTPYLTWSTNCIEHWKVNDEWISLVVFHPVTYNLSESLKNKKYDYPFYVALKDLNISDGNLEATVLLTNHQLKLSSSSKTENTVRVNKFLSELNNADPSDKSIFLHLLNVKMGDELVKHRYLNYWK